MMGKLSLVLGVMMLMSCGTIKESEEESSSGKLKEYEATFQPSDYDQPVSKFFPETSTPKNKDSGNTSTGATPQPLELTQGCRVQIFATSSFDEANKLKASAEGQFPEEWFYVVYDAPTYKLRAGNFQERYEADRFAKQLAEKGYRDAWVVPERVFKNPSPRPPLPQGTQK
ncbi:MAG: SPOR domain-containing protein [Bacteroidota bacterium]